LDDIKGIGPKTKEDLLKHFKSVANIKVATIEELATNIGPSKAQVLFNFFHKQPETSTQVTE
jgi:uvrABC system protein C